jgi:hypothetical protein
LPIDHATIFYPFVMEVEIYIPRPWKLDEVLDRLESTVSANGLRIALRGELREYPGSVHWHLKLQSEPGTLELTAWPAGQRVWFHVHRGRRAAWIEELLPVLQTTAERQLLSRPLKPRRAS